MSAANRLRFGMIRLRKDLTDFLRYAMMLSLLSVVEVDVLNDRDEKQMILDQNGFAQHLGDAGQSLLLLSNAMQTFAGVEGKYELIQSLDDCSITLMVCTPHLVLV